MAVWSAGRPAAPCSRSCSRLAISPAGRPTCRSRSPSTASRADHNGPVIGELLAAAVLGLGGAAPGDALARLAYVHGGSIYSIASDGSDRRPIANGFDPAFSPSGDALAFSRSRSVRRGAIAIATPDGSEPRTLVEDE